MILSTNSSRPFGGIVAMITGVSALVGCDAGPVQLGQRSAQDIAVQQSLPIDNPANR